MNNIYKAQILHNQCQILQAADKDYCVPVQGFQGVWPWEAMKLTVHLDSIGYHEDVQKVPGIFPKRTRKISAPRKFQEQRGTFGGTIGFEKSGWDKDHKSTLYGQLAKSMPERKASFPTG